MTQPLTTTIKIRDQDGRVVEEKTVATYAGLLALAHEQGLRAIATELVQAPARSNGMVAIVSAVAETDRGTFSGLGDAHEGNVHPLIAPHLVRVAETRAKARALRDATCIGLVALEELPEGDLAREAGKKGPLEESLMRVVSRLELVGEGGSTRTLPPPKPVGNPMTESQHRYLMRLLREHGLEGDKAMECLLESAGANDIGEITKRAASKLINSWLQAADAKRASAAG